MEGGVSSEKYSIEEFQVETRVRSQLLKNLSTLKTKGGYSSSRIRGVKMALTEETTTFEMNWRVHAVKFLGITDIHCLILA